MARRVSAAVRRTIATEQPNALLCVHGVTVTFDGFKALSDLTLVLREGELRTIIGPNGAGKTTLMDVMTGKTRPERGCVFFVDDDRDLTTLSEHEIARRGIGRKFQRPTVFPRHSVEENLELAGMRRKTVLYALFGRGSADERARVEEILETTGLADLRGHPAGTLSHGQKQWLEIGMLLAQDPRVLLVDEPAAGLSQEDAERTARLLAGLAGRHTVVVVEHDMDFVRGLAGETVTVLHEGKVLAEGSLSEVQNDPRVVAVYLGE